MQRVAVVCLGGIKSPGRFQCRVYLLTVDFGEGSSISLGRRKSLASIHAYYTSKRTKYSDRRYAAYFTEREQAGNPWFIAI